MPQLFVVGKHQAQQSTEEETDNRGAFEVSGNVAVDLETAVRAIAFLLEWIGDIGPEGLRVCADKVREFRKERS